VNPVKAWFCVVSSSDQRLFAHLRLSVVDRLADSIAEVTMAPVAATRDALEAASIVAAANWPSWPTAELIVQLLS